jgi:hypothetical protein
MLTNVLPAAESDLRDTSVMKVNMSRQLQAAQWQEL